MGSGGGIAGANFDTLSSSSSLPQGGGRNLQKYFPGGRTGERTGVGLGCRRNTIPGETFSQEKSYFAARALISSCLLMMTLTKRDYMLPGKQGCFERKKSFRIKLGDGIYLHYGRPKPMFSRCILCLPLFLSPPSYANKIYAHVLCDAYVGSRGGAGPVSSHNVQLLECL